jgi:hypothetical protein
MRSSLLALVLALLVAAGSDARAGADGPPPLPSPSLAQSDATWRVRSSGPLALDAGLLLATPVAMSTGMSTGVGGGATYGRGWWSVGARASWSTSTESSIAWTLSRSDIRLRAAAAVQRRAGRGQIGLRLALGPTIVHENRTRNQGARAGLTGTDLETSAFAALPAGELEAVLAVHVAGPWLLVLAGGPGLSIDGGGAHAGWTAGLGVGWQP